MSRERAMALERSGRLLLYWPEAGKGPNTADIDQLRSLQLPGLLLPEYCEDEGRPVLIFQAGPSQAGGHWLDELSLGLAAYSSLFRRLLELRKSCRSWGLSSEALLLETRHIAWVQAEACFCYLPSAQTPFLSAGEGDGPVPVDLDLLAEQDWLDPALNSALEREEEAFLEALGRLVEDLLLRSPEAQDLGAEVKQNLLRAAYSSPEDFAQIWENCCGQALVPKAVDGLRQEVTAYSDVLLEETKEVPCMDQEDKFKPGSWEAELPPSQLGSSPPKKWQQRLWTWFRRKLWTEGYYLLVSAALSFLCGSLLFSRLSPAAPDWALIPPGLCYLLALGLCLYSLFSPSSPLSGSTESPYQLRQKFLEERRYYDELRRKSLSSRPRGAPLARLYRLELYEEERSGFRAQDFSPDPSTCWLLLEEPVLAFGLDQGRCLAPLGLPDELALEWIWDFKDGAYEIQALHSGRILSLDGQQEEPGLAQRLPPRCHIRYGGLDFFYEQLI